VNKSTRRLRHWIVSSIAATTLLSGLAVIGFSSTASAINPQTGSIAAASNPSLAIGAVGQTPGNLAITLTPGDVITTGDIITINLADENGADTVFFDGPPVNLTATNNMANDVPTVETHLASNGELQIELGQGASSTPITVAGAGQVINITGILYTICSGAATPVAACGASAVPGPIEVTGTYAGAATNFTFTPPEGGATGSAATNAVLTNSPSTSLTALQTPDILTTGVAQSAGNWRIGFDTATGQEGKTTLNPGDKFLIELEAADSADCTTVSPSGPDDVGFSAVPTITVEQEQDGVSPNLASSDFTGSLTTTDNNGSTCVGNTDGIKNELVLTYSGPQATFTTAGHDDLLVDLTGVTITTLNANDTANTGSDGEPGNLVVTSGLNAFVNAPSPNGANGTVHTGIIHGQPSNAEVVPNSLTVTGDSPVTDMQFLEIDQFENDVAQDTNVPISPITFTEGGPGELTGGVDNYVCVVATDPSEDGGVEFNTTTLTPKVTVTGGGAVVANGGAVVTESTGSQIGDGTLEFQIATPSSTGPATYTLSNVAVNAGIDANPFATVIYNGDDPICDSGTTYSGGVQLYTESDRIGGADADGTAIQTCEVVNGDSVGHSPAGYENIVLATDADYQDALSAAYYAGKLDTCILLTPTAAISQETLQAIQYFGAQNVDVIGGPDAISNAAYAQLEATPAYYPGGLKEIQNIFSGTPYLLQVQRIFGQTADGTAEAVTQSFPFHFDGSDSFPAAYTTTAGGADMYNDTTGNSGTVETSAPDVDVQTALLATDNGFQDAASASVIAYDGLPLLLTNGSTLSPEAAAAIEDQGIQQVIVLGGPLAISDAVITQLEGLGVSVLRIAGQDYTDTSQLLAQFELNSSVVDGSPSDGLDWAESDGQGLTFARGDFYSDAIVAAEASFGDSEDHPVPILLTENPTTAGTYLTKFLNTEGDPATAYGHGTFAGFDYFVEYELIMGQNLAITGPLESTLAQDLG